MGNDHSKRKTTNGSSSQPQQPVSHLNSTNDAYFSSVCDQENGISFGKLTELFGEDLAESLFTFLTESSPKSQKFVTREQFSRKFTPLYGTSQDIYVKILQPVHHFIKTCSDSAGAAAIQGDELFISCLVENMTQGKTGEEAEESILRWRRMECEKFTQAVQSRVLAVISGNKHKTSDYSSDILTPLQMWYLQCCLPNVYFPSKGQDSPGENGAGNWTPLYTSLQHGISTNRFETFVFGYRGPTVTIFRLKDGRVVVIAADQEWRHSGSRFGGSFTSFFEIRPNIRRIDSANSIYCNLKLRSSPTGLNFKEELKVGKDFDEVLDIEVWGCSGTGTLAEQQKLKNWQKQQAEKHKKVPLPGNWDDNPDKTLLEMAGFHFSNERAAMEMSSRLKSQSATISESEKTDRQH